MDRGRDGVRPSRPLPVRGRAYYVERVALSAYERKVIEDIDRCVSRADPALAARFDWPAAAPRRRRWWWPFRRSP